MEQQPGRFRQRLRLRVTYLHNVIIKQQPEAVTLHYGDVMTSVWTTEHTQTSSESLIHRHYNPLQAATVLLHNLWEKNLNPVLKK